MKLSPTAHPPAEIIEFFRRKGWKIGFNWYDVWAEEQMVAFTVAKAMTLDILADIRESIDLALAEGIPFETFSENLMPTLQKKGWWGFQEIEDPLTGEVKSVELGTPRRLKIIFQTNLRSAYKYGQYQRIQRTKDVLPYLLRTLGPSREHREEHVAWNGICLPADDSWWSTHFPPNGFGCRCRVRQISGKEFERLEQTGIPSIRQKIDPESGLPTGHVIRETVPIITKAPPTQYEDWTNTRTGKTERVPKGIDPGWGYDMRKTSRAAFAEAQLIEKVGQFPEAEREQLLRLLAG